jgi:hypothetical protein
VARRRLQVTLVQAGYRDYRPNVLGSQLYVHSVRNPPGRTAGDLTGDTDCEKCGQALENAVAAGTADSSILKTLAAHFADGLARCSAALASAGLEALGATGRHVLGQLQDP